MYKLSYKSLVLMTLMIFSGAVQAKWQTFYQIPYLQISYQTLKNSDLYEVKAQITINATVDEFYQLLTDEQLAPTWLDKVANTQLIAEIDDKTFIVLTHFNGFGPVADRELLTQTTVIEKTTSRLPAPIVVMTSKGVSTASPAPNVAAIYLPTSADTRPDRHSYNIAV